MNSITTVTDDINIVVHAGTYAGDFSLVWPASKTSATHTVTIKRASGEAMPVFDGQGTNRHFLSLGDGIITAFTAYRWPGFSRPPPARLTRPARPT